ncbi:MAG: lipoprotein insertase outer membrane protein LolB, partial [Desulforhabdus sp.]|nr:lipoprotein insertase outer membrane protein LolB [Desulforhabdus sp.]
ARRPVPPMEKPGDISTTELISRLQARSAFWQAHQAKLEIKGESPKGKFRFQSLIVAQLPDRVRLEAYTTWGQTAGVLVIDGEDSSLYIPSEKVIYSASRAEDLVRYFLGVPIPIEVFGYSLIASVPPDQLDAWQIERDSSGWQATVQPPNQSLRFSWQFLSRPAAMQSLAVRGGQSEYTVSYEPAVTLDMQTVPKKINFVAAQWQMEVSVSQMRTTRGLQPAVFTLPFPQGVRKVSFD